MQQQRHRVGAELSTILDWPYQHNNDCAIHVYENSMTVLENSRQAATFTAAYMRSQIHHKQLDKAECATRRRLAFATLVQRLGLKNIFSSIEITDALNAHSESPSAGSQKLVGM